MEGSGLSASDVLALTKDEDGFLEGNGIIILILFFLIFGFGGNGFGNRGTAATQQDVANGFSFNKITVLEVLSVVYVSWGILISSRQTS